MEIKIRLEAGHCEAVTGCRFSHQVECPLDEIEEVTDPDVIFSRVLASKDGGHNKFLESIMVWVDIRATLKFWKQFDTYRMCTKQSKSTMHSIMKRKFSKYDFKSTVSIRAIDELNEYRDQENFEAVTDNLPDGYLQTRRVCISYKTIRSILKQREFHKLPEWRYFRYEMARQLKYPHLLGADVFPAVPEESKDEP